MTNDTLIDDLVRAGASAEIVGIVVRAFYVRKRPHVSTVSVDVSTPVRAVSTDAKRARDAERKRVERAKAKQINGSAKANDVAASVVSAPRPRTDVDASLDNAGQSSLSFLLSDLPSSVSKEEVQKSKEVIVARRAAAAASRGTRMTADWQPAAGDREWLRSKFDVVGQRCQDFLEEFIDFWMSVPGSRGLKSDWNKAMRVRARAVFANGKGKGHVNGKRNPTMEAFAELKLGIEGTEIQGDAFTIDLPASSYRSS